MDPPFRTPRGPPGPPGPPSEIGVANQPPMVNTFTIGKISPNLEASQCLNA